MKTRMLVGVFLFSLMTACGGIDGSPTSTPTPMPIPTNTPQPTTPPRALEVVYVRDGNIWLWVEGAGNSALTTVGGVSEVRISEDGVWIAYLQNDQLWLTRPDIAPSPNPSEYPKLLVSAESRIVQFDFDPQSKNIYFTAFINGVAGGLDLFRIRVDLPLPVRVVGPGLGGNYHISPDGQCLAITRPNQLDLWCQPDPQPRRVFEFAYECGFGVQTGPDIRWTAASDGFYVVAPVCDDNTLHGRERLYFVPRNGTAPQVKAEFVGWTYDPVFIAPDGTHLASLIDYGDLKSLHIIGVNGSDATYISLPSDDITFRGWATDSRHFIVWLKQSMLYNSFTGPLIASLDEMPVPLLTEDLDTTLPGPTISDVNWVSDSRFLFLRDGLWIETLKSTMVPIDATPGARIASYDFSPKPGP
ncbi:MAG TPA: hypothetical protein VMC09_02175 [Anaerolineales bacterium]|nr:hypothetical protein [Anaerolineales bacterium]